MSALSSLAPHSPTSSFPSPAPVNESPSTDNGPSPFPRSANSETSAPNPPPSPPIQNDPKQSSSKSKESPQPKLPPKVKEKNIDQPVSPAAFTLTTQHDQVILLLLKGHSDSFISKSLKISRTTLRRWRTCNPVFQAELNRARSEMWQTNLEHLRGLVTRSLRILDKSMRSKDESIRLKAATAMLSHAAPNEVAPSPYEPIDPEIILNQQVPYFRRQFNPKSSPDDPITDKDRYLTMQKLQSLLTAADSSTP